MNVLCALCMSKCLYERMCVCMYVYVYLCMNVYLYVCMYVCVYIYLYVYMSVSMCLCVYVYICMYVLFTLCMSKQIMAICSRMFVLLYTWNNFSILPYQPPFPLFPTISLRTPPPTTLSSDLSSNTSLHHEIFAYVSIIF